MREFMDLFRETAAGVRAIAADLRRLAVSIETGVTALEQIKALWEVPDVAEREPDWAPPTLDQRDGR